MIGTDIIEISRIEESIDDSHFISRLFTKNEIDYCHLATAPRVVASRFAVRFAAKEAVFKALHELTVLRWKEIEVVNEESGRPILCFYGDTLKFVKEKGINMDVSLSHSREYATAVAITI
jgi:holo-[acyl-carrier protein] synthase